MTSIEIYGLGKESWVIKNIITAIENLLEKSLLSDNVVVLIIESTSVHSRNNPHIFFRVFDENLHALRTMVNLLTEMDVYADETPHAGKISFKVQAFQIDLDI